MVAVAALVFTGCGNKSQGDSSATDSTNVTEIVSEPVDETAITEESKSTINNLSAELQKAIDSKDNQAVINVLANLQTIYKNLADKGNLEEAKAYGATIKQYVNSKADELKTVAEGNVTIAQLIEGVKNLPTSAATTAEEAKAAIKSDVTNLATPAIAKGQTVIENAEAAAEAVKNAPAAVKAAAEEAATKAVNDVKNSVNERISEEKAKNDAKVQEAKQKAADRVNEGRQKLNDAINNAANKTVKDILK